MIPQYIDEFKNNPKGFQVRKANKPKIQEIYASVPFVTSSLLEAVFCIEHQLTSKPRCQCGNAVGFDKGLHRYNASCSVKCSRLDPEFIKKKKATSLAKYGFEHPNQNQAVKDKIKQTTKQRLGVEHPLQSSEIRAKIASGHIQKYGVANPMQRPEIQEKVKQHNLEKHNHYGLNQNRPDVLNKIHSTMIARYGVKYTTQDPLLGQKVKEANLKSYWGDFSDLIQNVDQLTSEYTNLGLIGLANKLNTTTATLLRYLKDHGIKKTAYRSMLEEDVGIFLLTLDPDIQTNKHLVPNYEMDFISNSKKICFDIHGLFFHCELSKGKFKGKSKDYHLNKMITHNAVGYTVIQIFENEWVNKREAVESRIRNLLGLSNRGAAARICTIRDITWAQAKEFLNQHHIQGAGTSGNVRLGAFDGNTLVGVMTFSKGRVALNNLGKGWELLRFATDGLNHPGLAGKLLKNFELKHKPTELTSYADRRWSTGNLYEQLGFTFAHNSSPSYWYTKDYQELKHRYNFTKHKTIEMGGDPTQTEWQNMQDLGYDRIWDCGNSKWIKYY